MTEPEKLEAAIRERLNTEGRLPCAAALALAKKLDVPPLQVGEQCNSLGIKITDCQLGCFKVSKTDRTGAVPEPASEELARRVQALHDAGELTCPNLFALAGELGCKPLVAADAANARGYKLGGCQLGCF